MSARGFSRERDLFPLNRILMTGTTAECRLQKGGRMATIQMRGTSKKEAEREVNPKKFFLQKNFLQKNKAISDLLSSNATTLITMRV